MFAAVEQLTTNLITAKLSSMSILARYFLFFFSAMTFNGNLDKARRTDSWMTQQVTPCMGAMFMLLSITVFTARMRQGHRWVSWLFVSSTIAFVGWQVILSVSIVAVRTSPSVEGTQHLALSSLLTFLRVVCSFFKVILFKFFFLLNIITPFFTINRLLIGF